MDARMLCAFITGGVIALGYMTTCVVIDAVFALALFFVGASIYLSVYWLLVSLGQMMFQQTGPTETSYDIDEELAALRKKPGVYNVRKSSRKKTN